MSDAALLVVDSLSSAVETTLNPSAPKADRHAAYCFIEEFKEKSPLVSEVGALLAKKPGVPILRSFGLQLLEYSIRFRWNIIPVEEKVFIKESVMELLNTPQDILNEAVYVKEGIARLVVEMAKREWPQQWGSFLNEIFEGCLPNGWKAELSLIILLRLSEDIGVLENVENPKRRKDMYQQFTASLFEILEFLDNVLTHYVGLLHLEGAAIPDQLEKTKIIQAALRALSSVYEWCSLSIVGEDQLGILTKLLQLLHDQRFRILSAECLSSITRRRDFRSEILLKFFERQYMEGIFSAAEQNTGAAVMEESYTFDKKCAEVFLNLGSLLLHAWSKIPNFELPSTTKIYFKVLVRLVDHDSLIIRDGAVAQVNSLLRAAIARSSHVVDFLIPMLVPVLIKRLPKVGYPYRTDHPSCKLSVIDFDSDEDFNLVFQRSTSNFIGLLKYVSPLKPDLCFREALKYLCETIEKVLPNLTASVDPKSELCAQVHASAQAIDAVCDSLAKNSQLQQQHCEEGSKIFHSLLQILPKDLHLLDEIMNCVSALLYCCRNVNDMQTLVIYCNDVMEANSAQRGDFLTFRREVRRHAAAIVAKGARVATHFMIPLLDELIAFAERVSGREDFSVMDGNILKDAALILVNELKDSQKKAQYIIRILQPLPKQWNELPVDGPNAFLDYYGLAPTLYDNIVFRQRRSEITSFITTVRYVLARVRPSEGQNAAFPIVSELLPNLLRFMKVMIQLYAWSSHAPKDLAPGFDVSKGEKVGLLCQGIMDAQEAHQTINAVSASSDEFVAIMLKFIPVTFHSMCELIGQLGFAMEHEFYRIPGLAAAISQSLLGDLKMMPEYRQKTVIKCVSALVEHCQPTFYDNFAIPLIGATFNQVSDHLNNRWLEVIARVQTENPDREATETEILAETIMRELSRELLDLVKIIYNGPKTEQPSKQPGTTDSDENVGMLEDEDMGERNGTGQGKPETKQRPVSDLAKAALSSDGVAQSLLMVQIRSLCWPDSSSSIKSTNTLLRTLEFMQVHLPGGDIGVDLATSILMNALQGLEVNGQHEANRDALLALILKLFSYCGKIYSAMHEILDRIPQSDDGASLNLFRKLFDTPGSVAKIEKQKKDALRKTVEPFIGKHSGQLYKREVHMKSLPALNLKPRKIPPPPLEETEDTVGLVGLFGNE